MWRLQGWISKWRQWSWMDNQPYCSCGTQQDKRGVCFCCLAFDWFQRVVSCVLSDFQTVSIDLCVFNAINSAKWPALNLETLTSLNLSESWNEIDKRQKHLHKITWSVSHQVPQHCQVLFPPCGRRVVAVRRHLREQLPQRSRVGGHDRGNVLHRLPAGHFNWCHPTSQSTQLMVLTCFCSFTCCRCVSVQCTLNGLGRVVLFGAVM